PPDTDVANVPLLANPALELVKSATPSHYDAVGQVITYSYKLTNTGNVTLPGSFSVTDDKLAAVVCPATASLAPAGSMTCTARHTFSQAQLDANGSPTAGNGFLTNTVTASSNEAPSAIDTLNIPIVQTRALRLVKSASPLTYDAPGQVISYEY